MRLLGDLAIYVAPGSADHRAHPELFQRGVVAGAPPDAFSAHRPAVGQPALRLAGAAPARYRWWVERMRRTLELFDVARIDHFRGFVAYWAVPEGARTALGRTLAAGTRARAVRRDAARARRAAAWSPRISG